MRATDFSHIRGRIISVMLVRNYQSATLSIIEAEQDCGRPLANYDNLFSPNAGEVAERLKAAVC